eukprot:359832-Chlamydomonas_euryale.AAC.1
MRTRESAATHAAVHAHVVTCATVLERAPGCKGPGGPIHSTVFCSGAVRTARTLRLITDGLDSSLGPLPWHVSNDADLLEISMGEVRAVCVL